MKYYKITCILIFFIIISLPLAGLIFYKEPEGTENKVLAEAPQFVAENGINIHFLQDASDYFSDHFAFRQELVTANTVLKSSLFGESAEELAVYGTDDWLYLTVSLEDYQGTNLMTERGLNNITRTLSLMQEYTEDSLGKQFIFTVAPNKNTLYPEHMPYYYVKYDGEHNLDRLAPKLTSAGVRYVDLKAYFEEQDEVLYHKGDSHWNNRGAVMVQDLLLTEAGVPHTDFTGLDYEIRNDFEGDIDKILFPRMRHTEAEYDYSKYLNYDYLDKTADVTQNTIETECADAQGKLLCFRDSFGNSLLPFLANEFQYGYFLKTVPYRLDYMSTMDMDVCILEIVERNLDQLVRFAPVMPAPLRDLEQQTVAYGSEETTAEITTFENYYKLYGLVDAAYVSDDSYIYIRLTSQNGEFVIEAAPVNEKALTGSDSDYGYVAYIGQNSLPQGEYTVEIITENEEVYSCMTGIRLTFK